MGLVFTQAAALFLMPLFYGQEFLGPIWTSCDGGRAASTFKDVMECEKCADC